MMANNNSNNQEKLSFKLVKENDVSSFMKAFYDFKEQNIIDDRPYFDLKLCIEELLVNIFKYGYCNVDQKPEIQVNICKTDSKIEVEVSDNAKAFDILKKNIDESNMEHHLEDKHIGGLGIRFIKEFSDELEYIPKNTGNKVIIKKLV